MTKYNGPIKEVEVVEKVKLTQEQSTALEKMRNCHHLRNDKEKLLIKHVVGWMNAYQTLNEIPMLDFAQLVLNDFAYEIEPEEPKFEAGDKVFVNWDDGGQVHTIKRIGNNGRIILDRDFALNCHPLAKIVRLATPEEVFWLEELGREKVGEFKYTDVFIDGDGDAHLLSGVHPSDGNGSLEDAEYWYAEGFFKGIYPADSFRPFPKEPSHE